MKPNSFTITIRAVVGPCSAHTRYPGPNPNLLQRKFKIEATPEVFHALLGWNRIVHDGIILYPEKTSRGVHVSMDESKHIMLDAKGSLPDKTASYLLGLINLGWELILTKEHQNRYPEYKDIVLPEEKPPSVLSDDVPRRTATLESMPTPTAHAPEIEVRTPPQREYYESLPVPDFPKDFPKDVEGKPVIPESP